jgi:hypothetical protein
MKKRNKKYTPRPLHVPSIFLHMMDRAGIETPLAVVVDVNEDGTIRPRKEELIQGAISYGNSETQIK